jgi:putative restriction endonuclease
MEVLRAVLPHRYSPLQPSGNGVQSIYLTELSQDFAEVLGGLIGEEVRSLMAATAAGAAIRRAQWRQQAHRVG